MNVSDTDNLPEDTQLFSWRGFSLDVPREWNLTHHRGSAHHGLVILTALRGKRLEVRWQTGRARRLRKLYNKLCKRAQNHQKDALITRWPGTQDYQLTEIVLPQERLFLILTPQRLFECSFPPHISSAQALAITRSLRDHLREINWPWQLYGIDGLVPASYKLRVISLFPGASHLEFRKGFSRILLGSFSRADALLAGRSLADFARSQIALLKHYPIASSQSSPNREEYVVMVRRLLIKRKHHVVIEYRPADNIILWRDETGASVTAH